MDVATAIRTRRSARDYSSRPVPASVLRDLIAAASWAPSAMNAQSWCFSVVTDTALLDDISRQAKAWLLDSVQDMPRPGHFRDLLSDPHFQLFYNAPALVVISATGGKDTVALLVVSQVVLSMQLPFAIFPLMMVTSSRMRMGDYANPLWVKVVGYAICSVIAVLNVYLLWQTIGPVWVGVMVGVAVVFAGYVWVSERRTIAARS